MKKALSILALALVLGLTLYAVKAQAQMGPGMVGEGMRTPPEDMRKMMREVISPKEVPFYQEKTFLVTVTVAFILIIAWMIKRWGIRPWRALRRQGPFVNEAILVVDLCESTKVAVTQGDAFAMRIKNKMKECVREVSESFGAKFFESTGDGYLITFPRGIEAVRAAIKILQNADDYNRDTPEKEKIELRVGINYGEMILDEQGGRHGAAINKAFRIEGLKKEQQERLGGGLKPEEFPEKNRILVSEEVKEEMSRAEGIQVQLAGVFNLKGFTALHRIYCIPWKDVATD
jgi:class 3 adenylate cyclase